MGEHTLAGPVATLPQNMAQLKVYMSRLTPMQTYANVAKLVLDGYTPIAQSTRVTDSIRWQILAAHGHHHRQIPRPYVPGVRHPFPGGACRGTSGMQAISIRLLRGWCIMAHLQQ